MARCLLYQETESIDVTLEIMDFQNMKGKHMNKNSKFKTTCRARRRIVRKISYQGSQSSRTSGLEAVKVRLSAVDFYYSPLNDLLKKKLHDKAPLTYKEELQLGSMLNLFNGFECCYDEVICKSDTCIFAGIPEEWVRYEGFEFLCDLIYNYIDNESTLNPPGGCDIMNIVVQLHARA